MANARSWTRYMGEALAAAGVIGSLIFVGIEIQQNTQAVRGATTQAISQQSLDLVMAGLDNPDLREAFASAQVKAPADLSVEEKRLLSWFYSAKLRADENRFRQAELGLINDNSFGQLSNNKAYRHAYFRAWWASRGNEFAPDFQVFVERNFLPLSEPTVTTDES